MNEEEIFLNQIPKAIPSRYQAKTVSRVLDRLFLEKGYANEQSRDALLQAWTDAVGPGLSGQSRVGQLKRGALQIYASNEIVRTELEYMKTKALASLQASLPEMNIRSLKIHLQRYGS
ncbi:DUF721 domain-containing protein [Pirellulaceae bacterium SH501]